METIILVTVFSTLGVVALVTAIAVAFVKLNKKVDVNTFDQQLNDVHGCMSRIEESIYKRIEDSERDIYDNFQRVESLIDSRCDKLHTEITNSKQLLKG